MFKSMFSPAQSNEDAQRDEALKSLILTEDLNNFLYKLSTVMGFNKDSVHVVDTGTCRQYRFYHREEAGMLLRYIQQDRFRDVPDIGKAKVSQLRAQVRAQAELGKVHPYTVRLMPYQIAAINGITTQQAQEAAAQEAAQAAHAAEFDKMFPFHQPSQAFVIAIKAGSNLETVRAEVEGLEKDFQCSFGIKFDGDGCDGDDVMYRVGSLKQDPDYSQFAEAALRRLSEIDGVRSVEKHLFPEIVISDLRGEGSAQSGSCAL